MAAGKTTLAHKLRDKYDYFVMSFASPIKTLELELAGGKSPLEITHRYMSHLDPMQKAMFVKILEQAEKLPRELPKPRKRLQFIGTDGGRNQIDKNIWVDIILKEANRHERVVIDDGRFVNEFICSKENGFKSVVLVLDPGDQLKRLKALYGDTLNDARKHASEIDIASIINLNPDLLINTTYTNPDQVLEIVEKCILDLM
jgi:hypothetical protein